MRYWLTVSLLLSAPWVSAETEQEKNIIIELPSPEEQKRIEKAVNQRLDKLTQPVSPERKRQILEKTQKALAVETAPIYPAAKFTSKTQFVDLVPGRARLRIPLAPGLPVAITLKDQTGQPVPWVFESSSPAVTVFKPGESKSDKDTPMPYPNMAIIKPEIIAGSGNILLLTDRSDLPISIQYEIGKPPSPYVDRYILIINDPQAAPTVEQVSLDDRSQMLRVLNNMAPGEDYRQAIFGPEVTAWDNGQNMWLRTRARLLGMATATSGSLNGVNAYRVPSVGAITLLDNEGRIRTLRRVLDE